MLQITDITVPSPDPFQGAIFGSIILLIVASVVAISVWVYRIGYPEIEKGQTKMPQISVIILVIIAVVGPEAIRISYDSSGTQDIYLTAMWLNIVSIVLAGNAFNASFFVFAIPLTLLRLTFPTMVYRYYRSMTTRKRVLITGVVVELPMLLFGLPLLLLLIVGLLIAGLLPIPKGPTTWLDHKE
ncbi:MAG: hypothetical protein KAR33_08185 [Candidatus Thorarchaeota archaeon]|nr:hypothetical protein [Candidatus Thorarchaeota archaeon]